MSRAMIPRELLALAVLVMLAIAVELAPNVAYNLAERNMGPVVYGHGTFVSSDTYYPCTTRDDGYVVQWCFRDVGGRGVGK